MASPTTIQTLPSLALKYRAAQSSQIDLAIEEVSARWRRMGPRFDSSWALLAGAVTALVGSAQHQIAERASIYVPAILADTDQQAFDYPLAEPNPPSFVGFNRDGLPIASVLAVVTIRAKQAVGEGQSPREALTTAGDWLASSVNTLLADTGRAVEQAGLAAYPVGGYIRMVNPSACIRCVVLAGRWYRWNEGFDRHPECRCEHVPAGKSLGEGWLSDPYELFNSLDEAGQIKLMGSRANAQAVRDGADIFQVGNAQRGMSKSGRFTAEGMTRHGFAGQVVPQGYQRLTPGLIYQRANAYGWTRDRIVAELTRYGYITPLGQIPTGALRGQREGWGQLGSGGDRRNFGRSTPRVAARQAIEEARRTGVRDPMNRYTMTAAERRLYDARRRYETALSGVSPYTSPGFGNMPDPYGLGLNAGGVSRRPVTATELRWAREAYEFELAAKRALDRRLGR